MITIFVPRDAAALSVGADEVATAIASEAKKRKADVRIVRNGSRGMLYLEPLVEVETAQGRVAYGPVTAKDRASFVALADWRFPKRAIYWSPTSATTASRFSTAKPALTKANSGRAGAAMGSLPTLTAWPSMDRD